jgi:hypothetical protein
MWKTLSSPSNSGFAAHRKSQALPGFFAFRAGPTPLARAVYHAASHTIKEGCMSSSSLRTVGFFGAPLAGALIAALIAIIGLFGAAHAQADEEFLDPAVAFKFKAAMRDGDTIAVTYRIADGYYMYRDRFKFSATGATLGAPNIPPGKVK